MLIKPTRYFTQQIKMIRLFEYKEDYGYNILKIKVQSFFVAF